MIPADILLVLILVLIVVVPVVVLIALGERIAAKRQRLVEPETAGQQIIAGLEDAVAHARGEPVVSDELPTFLKRTPGDQAALRSQCEGRGGKIL